MADMTSRDSRRDSDNSLTVGEMQRLDCIIEQEIRAIHEELARKESCRDDVNEHVDTEPTNCKTEQR